MRDEALEYAAYYVREVDDLKKLHAGPKARKDFESICMQMGFAHIDVDISQSGKAQGSSGKLSLHRYRAKKWAEELLSLRNAVIFVNFPLLNHSLFHWTWMKKFEQNNCRLVLLVHDLNILRPGYDSAMGLSSRIRFSLEEKSMLKRATKVIVHNKKMKSAIIDRCGIPEEKFVELECFDYLALDDFVEHRSVHDPIVIAGNLSAEKSDYIYQLIPRKPVALYGASLDGEIGKNVSYVGGFAPDVLPGKLVGSFGLVWDGPSVHSCKGVFGDYLRFNNPHKTSLYISAGLPVLVWEEAAIADFVTKHRIGIAGRSVDELIEKAMDTSEEEYSCMLRRVQQFALLVRQGWFSERAIREVCTSCGISLSQLDNREWDDGALSKNCD